MSASTSFPIPLPSFPITISPLVDLSLIHIFTPDEIKSWGLSGGKLLQTFDTDCAKVGVLICYDVEFPELSRLMADQGMQILFVPFLTDTQNAYSRVRVCAQDVYKRQGRYHHRVVNDVFW